MSTAIGRHLQQRRAFRSLEEEVFVGLQLAADRLMVPWSRALREAADLTEVQYNVLRVLRGAGADGLLAGEIGPRLITRRPDVTRLVDRLVKRGLAERIQDPGDRRAVRVRITPDGRARIGQLDDLADVNLASCLGGLTPERLETLRDILGELLDAVDPVGTAGAGPRFGPGRSEP